MEYESKKFYYISAEAMAEDGFVNGRRDGWSGAWGAIVDFAQVVPTIGELPRDGWDLTADNQGLKTSTLIIGSDGNVRCRESFDVVDTVNNGGKTVYRPERPLTAEESAFATGELIRLLTAKDAAAKRQAEMVARINAGDDCDPSDME